MKVEVILADRGSVTIRSDLELSKAQLLDVVRKSAQILGKFDRRGSEEISNTGGDFGFGLPPKADDGDDDE